MIILSDIPKEPGVYCIQNNINNKFYIGSSKNLYKRYYAHRTPAEKSRSNMIIYKAITKYGVENFTFFVLKITKNYLLWENLFIKLLKPEYNSATMIGEAIQPNIGKKFNQNWIDKLPKCKKHSSETKEKLLNNNKNNACKILFEKDNTVLYFNSWVDAGNYFNIVKSPAGCFTKTKKSNNVYKWKGWIIERLSTQTKKVKLQTVDDCYIFKSSYECDKFMNLWRGATSNAIRNNYGELQGCKVEYI